ncbi:MAG: hypothetical protein IJZ08_06705 [Clostridia bacterium]|nr:hypothetical protein [Clostridia bacterium]
MARKTKPQIDKLCKYCEMAVSLNNPDQMLCKKRGVVSAGYACRLFRYDVLKRDPGEKPQIILPDMEESE